MNEPTEEEIKRLWEWCGFKMGISPYGDKCLYYPDGGWDSDADINSVELPIDLNNLFKYGSPLFVSMACGSINEENWKGAWAKVITHDRQGIGEIREEGLTPALALFWAIYKVIEND